MRGELLLTTMKEIAARCGCSVATVSKALNGMPDIGPEMVKKVQMVAEELGYVLNATARTLRTNRSNTIGLLFFLRGVKVWTHEYFSSIAENIQSVVEPAGFDISPIACAQEGYEGRYLQYCIHRGYDGVIVVSAGFQEPGLIELVESSLPLVTIDYSFPHRNAVLSDNQNGMKELVDYIYSRGHRRIAYIHGGLDESKVSQDRVDAFVSACRAKGIEPAAEYIYPARYRDMEESGRAAKLLLSLPNPPTCIIFPDDYAYIGGMNAIMDAGLRIPQDISVAGYDAIPLASLLRPKLTTVAQNAEEIGRYTGQLILETILSGGKSPVQHVVVPSSLAKGETIADLTRR